MKRLAGYVVREIIKTSDHRPASGRKGLRRRAMENWQDNNPRPKFLHILANLLLFSRVLRIPRRKGVAAGMPTRQGIRLIIARKNRELAMTHLRLSTSQQERRKGSGSFAPAANTPAYVPLRL